MNSVPRRKPWFRLNNHQAFTFYLPKQERRTDVVILSNVNDALKLQFKFPHDCVTYVVLLCIDCSGRKVMFPMNGVLHSNQMKFLVLVSEM